MTHSTRRTPVALTAMVILVAAIHAHVTESELRVSSPGTARQSPQSAGVQTTITATAVIRGQVTSAANGAPIRAAEVRVRATNGRDNRLATTDDQGRFEVRDLSSGEWRIQASKAGFVTGQYGQSHPLDGATPINLTNGQRFTADVALIRGGAIGGHVVDEAGEPISGAQVQVMRSRMFQGRRQLVASGTGDQTDDTGAFRVYGLVPGDYYVSAIVRAPEDVARGTTASVTAYFPGTRSIRDAQRVTLGPGEDQSAISIAAPRPSAPVQVSGMVFTSSGAPAAGASVHLYNSDDLSAGTRSVGNFVNADAGGRFTAAKIPPGSYTLEATSRFVGDIGTLERGVAPIDVGGTDLTGVAIAMKASTTLTGTVVADAGSVLPRMSNIEITAQSTDGIGGTLNIHTASANRFTIPALSGSYSFAITELSDGWIVKALEINGEDVADSIVDFTDLGPIANARVVLTDRGGEVSGIVASRGVPRRASVVVFPSDAAKWTYPSRFIRTGRADADGGFRIAGLLPARYRVVAVTYLEDSEYLDSEFLERISKAATEFSLGEGEKKTIQLTVVPR